MGVTNTLAAAAGVETESLCRVSFIVTAQVCVCVWLCVYADLLSGHSPLSTFTPGHTFSLAGLHISILVADGRISLLSPVFSTAPSLSPTVNHMGARRRGQAGTLTLPLEML